MIRTTLLGGLFALALLVGSGGPVAWSDDKKDEKAEKKMPEPKEGTEEPAASINFAKELGLDFESLTTLGSRIDRARKDADPVGLAAVATELGVAEKVSGKKVKLTAATLLEEATELATMRNRSTELKAVALLVGDEKKKESLTEAAGKAATLEKRLAKGEKERGLSGTLFVDNATGDNWDVYVNGVFRGFTFPYLDARLSVNHGPWTNTVIRTVNRRTGRALRWTVLENRSSYRIVIR